MANEYSAIDEILDRGGVDRNGVLIVHSSFAKLSRAGWRAEDACAAFLKAMPNGTVMMPTMTWRTVTPQNPVFDVLRTPSHTGVLTEVFRTQFATDRSLHPTHSVAGCGPLAERLLSYHHRGTTPCPASSPYGLLRDYPASILLLEVGLESCTAFHHAEEIVAVDHYVRPVSESEAYDLIDRDGTVHKVRTRRHLRLDRDFPKFEPYLAALGELVSGVVADSRWRLLSVAGLYRLLFRNLLIREDAMLRGVPVT